MQKLSYYQFITKHVTQYLSLEFEGVFDIIKAHS